MTILKYKLLLLNFTAASYKKLSSSYKKHLSSCFPTRLDVLLL